MTIQNKLPNNAPIELTASEAESAINSFSRFLQFETVTATAPETGAYVEAADYILDQLRSIPCLDSIHCLNESLDNSPVVVARWAGTNPDLPIILLNSHYDVVPANMDDWTVEPFAGLRKDGKVYGRGAQDMKCVCIQYIEAIRKLHSMKEFTPTRSIYLTFVPDEEVGGSGMATFLSSKLYKSLPGIALALDEGLASTTSTYSVFYGERLPWWVDITATGNTGHGSRFISNTAVEQIIEVANKALAFREGQRAALHGSKDNAKHMNCAHAVAAKKRRMMKEKKGTEMTLGDVTTLNITTLEAGVKAGNDFVYNCVPPTAKCSMDIRISPHVNPSDMKNMLDQWCQECSSSKEDGHKLEWKYIDNQGSVNDLQSHALTSTDVRVNPWYGVFSDSLTKMGMQFEPEVFPAATDSRFLRLLGIRALGFSPMRNSEILLHENDEHLDESVFVEGIGVYVGLIESLSSQNREVDILADGKCGDEASR
jgi:aminoacylase